MRVQTDGLRREINQQEWNDQAKDFRTKMGVESNISTIDLFGNNFFPGVMEGEDPEC
jgi:hypothetical protein